MKVARLERYGKGDTYRIASRTTKAVMETVYTHTGGWMWVELDDDGSVLCRCRTDKDGRGLWIDDRQVLGTCQYRAAQTASGQRKKIMRDHEGPRDS